MSASVEQYAADHAHSLGHPKAHLRNEPNRGAKVLKIARLGVGVAVLGWAIWWLAAVADWGLVATSFAAIGERPWALAAALATYAAAFAIRALAWTWLQPGITFGHAFSAIHVGLAANHVLPFRLGEVFRITSATRRAGLSTRETTGVTVTLRLGDLLALLLVGAAAAPAALSTVMPWPLAIAAGLALAVAIAVAWRVRGAQRVGESAGRFAAVASVTAVAWVLEAAVLFAVADAAGLPLTFTQAVGVTAVTVLAQTVAVTPGGFGTYEAAGTAALVVLGLEAGPAFAVVLATHAIKTGYSLAAGAVALVAPAPTYWGRFRVPASLPPRPEPIAATDEAPIVVFIPAFNEEEMVRDVVSRVDREIAGHPVEVVVIDDGSTDDTVRQAQAGGATVARQPRNLGLGAAVRRGLAEASARQPAAGVYLDADGEYRPEDIPAVVAPVLDGSADYVIGSRFAGTIDHMHSHRRFGNRVLTVWVKWMTRRPDLTDGQSGFRAFSPAALAAGEVIHDYNYAQVLTLDLIAKGFVYDEVPIGYAFRTTGESFISLGKYLRNVLPAVHRELNDRGPKPVTAP